MKAGKFLGIAALIYSISCIPNSIKISKELKNLSDEFIRTAKTSDAKTYKKDYSGWNTKLETNRLMDYGGKLDKIIEKRNNYLKQNNSFLINQWRVSCDASRRYAEAPTLAFCWNPLLKVKKYK